MTNPQPMVRRVSTGVVIRLGVLNLVWNLALAANYRIIASGDLLATAITDFILAYIAVMIFKSLQKAETNYEKFFYALGGSIGAVVGVILTKSFHS